jgi:nitroreductase
VNFLDLARQRKSVRRYSSQKPEREVIQRCLEAARLAPSACNAQPWYFIVVDDPKTKDELAQAAFSGIYQPTRFAAQAPVIVALVRQPTAYVALMGKFFRGLAFSLIDIGIAGEHFVLQAAEEGLGTCWIGWFNEKAAKKVLGLSANQKLDILISVGYPPEGEVKQKPRKPLHEISRFLTNEEEKLPV